MENIDFLNWEELLDLHEDQLRKYARPAGLY